MNQYEQNFIFWQLLLYGVHIGHRFRNSSLYAGWLVFTYTYKTLIINLYKTILGFRNGYLGYDYCTKSGSPVWFLNLNKAFDIYTNESALRCGEFAYSTYWIHGMISNWLYLSDQMNQLWHYTQDAWKGQFRKLEMDYTPWLLSRWSWPRAVLITSVHTSEWPSHECLVSNTSSIGIVDTNIPGHISNIATPGNDDSLDSMVYYNTSSAQYILEKKYGCIVGWLFRVRESQRNISFADWVLRYYINRRKPGFHINIRKLNYNISQRQKRQKMDDLMFNIVKFKLNVTNYWDQGIRYFFRPGSGEAKFQGSLDLYSQDGLEINDRWNNYAFLEKFKQRGFHICKILNYYLLKRVWNTSSSYVVRKKFMSNRWFKFRFLTTVYYKEEWYDDYYKTNFLVNRFWRNRIFKTYFRWRGFRKAKFATKFFKFYNVYRYNKKRGFMDNFSASFLKKSSFASVAFSYGFNYFKKHFYSILINRGRILKTFIKNNKTSDMPRWLFFKRNVIRETVKLMTSHYRSKYMQFSTIYRTFSLLKNKINNFVYIIYCYINFYFTFWFRHRKAFHRMKRTKGWRLTKIFRSLKRLPKFPRFVDLYNKSSAPYKRLQLWFLNNFVDVTSYDLFNFKFAKFLNMISLNSRKTYFTFFIKYRYKKINYFRKYFKKLKKSHGKARHRNYVIDTLDFKYNKFKDTPEVRKKVEDLHKRIRINNLIVHYNKKYNFKMNPINTSFKKVFNIVKKKDKPVLRLLAYNALKYNLRHFNFFQVSKNVYNKKFTRLWTEIITPMEDEDSWLIKNLHDMETPSLFYEVFSKTRTPIHNMVTPHNLDYFNIALIKTTFSSVLRHLKLILDLNFFKFLKNLKPKRIILKYLKKYKKVNRFINKKFEKIKILKSKYKKLIGGRKNQHFLVGNKIFDNLKFVNLWLIIKKNFFREKGFDFRIWAINFNKNLMKGKKSRYLKLIKEDTSSHNNFTYIFFLRFVNIFSKNLSILKNKLIYKINSPFLKASKYTLYDKRLKKIYWY